VRTWEATDVATGGGGSATADAVLRGSLRRQTHASARAPLGLVPPVMDAAALTGALAITGHLDGLGLAFAITAFVALRLVGGDASAITPRLADVTGSMVAVVAVSLLGVALVAEGPAQAGRLLPLAPWAVGLVLAFRGAAYAAVRSARRHGLVVEPTLIVGAGEIGRQVANAMQEHPEFGLVPVGVVDSVEDADLPVPVLGPIEDLDYIVRVQGVRRVIIAFGPTREPNMVEVLRACDHLPIEVHVVPRFFELGLSAEGRFRDDLWGIPLVRLRRSALRSVAWGTKRVFDLLMGSIALAITSPLFLLAAGAVALSGRPIFFRQVRIGQRGRPFACLKFRTLVVNEDSDTAWSVDGDGRVTTVGRILRRLSLDELPQLFNVLRGDMSLIGPRPERPFFVERFAREIARYDDRHRVPMGITGWAQIHGLRGDTSIPERVRFDNYYIEHWSLWLDVVVLLRTISLILIGRH
jgi:exopolysaccharide biosynthesis polyprenyl glycosylphosphotransferase